jgi:hypothetical protein
MAGSLAPFGGGAALYAGTTPSCWDVAQGADTVRVIRKRKAIARPRFNIIRFLVRDAVIL